MNQQFILNDILNVRQESELLYANNERSLLIPSKAFGILQRDLIENIGFDRMKAFYFNFGRHNGEMDAQIYKDHPTLSMEEKILLGPAFHLAKGLVHPQVTEPILEMENGKIKKFLYRGTWENSNDAEQYNLNFGKSEHPVCFSLIGYASGYISEVVGEKVFFKELQCEGQGASSCIWEGRLLSDWDREDYEEFFYYKDFPIIKELEETNNNLLVEKNNLSMVTKLHSELTAEVIKGNQLENILEIVHRKIDRPVIVEDIHHQIVALAGIHHDEYEPIGEEFKSYLRKNKAITKEHLVKGENCVRLVAPIYIGEKIVGYCSFFYEREPLNSYEIDSMIIGRVSAICSMMLINEKTKIDSVERMKGLFLEEIISGKYLTVQEIIKRAAFLELDLTGDYFTVVLKPSFQGNNEKNELSFHRALYEFVTTYFIDKGMNILVCQRADSLLMLIPENQLHGKKIQSVLQPFLTALKRSIRLGSFLIGISSKNIKLHEIKNAFDESRIALRFSTKEASISTFDDLGMIGVLINDQNEQAIRKIARLYLGKLYEKLDDNKLELIETLYHFLDFGGNLEQTADKLGLSVSGLRYRMNKITDLLDHDLRDPGVQFQLLLSLKALKIIENN
jgi:PucR family transcriptional regulator, purine catabolism regulatory protein